MKTILLACAVVLGACGPAYLTAATQPAWNVKGPLAPVIESGGGAVTGSIGFGLGGRSIGFEATLHGVGVGEGTIAMPDVEQIAAANGAPVPASADDEMEARYATAHSTLEARWTVVRWRRLGVHLRGGASHGLVLDKPTLSREWGIGYKAGAGVELRLHKHVVVWIDAAQTTLRFARGPAEGHSTLRGMTIGVALGR